MASSLLQESRKIYADNQEELDTHRAAAADDVKKLEALVERKAPLVDDSTGETPLHVAASRGSVKVIKWLLDKEVTSPFEKANNGNTAAHYAAVYGHFPALKLILTHNRSTSNQLAEQKDETGHTVASLAAVQGDEEMFQWIIEHFPKVGTIPNAHGNLPIHFAAASGSVNMMKLLVKKYGKEIAESVDAHKTKPIYFAAQEGKIDALSYLIDELRVDPEAMDEDGNVTIHAAALANQLETVKYLVSKLGPDCIVKKTSDGATPLHLAAGNGHISVLEFLLSKLSNKADVDVLDDIHATPAHDAVENGHTEALAVLLKYGADVNITDSVKKTPLDLAVELKNTEMVNLLNEFSQNGQAALIKYKKSRTRKDSITKVRTSKQEAEEVLEATVKSADIMEERKTRQLERQKSLQKMNEAADESSAHAEQGEEARATVEHQNGPMGDIYARPNKKVHKRGPKKGQDGPDGGRATEAQGNSDELLDTKKGKTQESKSRSQGVSEQGIGVSLDTISNYSRPSRVKRHQDTESEHSYHSGVSSNNSYTHQSNVSASQIFAQQYVPYPGYPPMVPMMPHMGVANPMKQHSGSSISSRDGIQPGYPMPPYGPYGMYPPPMPGYGYYPGGGQYPPYPQLGYFHPRTTEERMHLAELQRGAVMHRGGGYPMPGGRRHNHRNASGESPTRLPRPDQDIGYGPTTDAVGTAQQSHQAHSEETDIHPPTPPITKRNGEESTTSDVVKFDSNFIMVKKDQQGSSVSKVGETTLNAAKHTLLVYDGRYDQYIMADPDDEEDIPEHCQVAFGAECAAILALACVVSFKGIEKQRIKKKSKQSNDKLNSSSQWDQPPTTNSSQLARRGSFTEELSKQIAQIAEDSNNKTGNTESELLSPDNAMTSSLHGQGFMSLSKQLGQKIISDSLWARNTSMMNIASTSLAGSRAGSRASLNQTSGEEDNLSDEDLDDADIVSIMEGVDPSETIRRKKLVAAQRKQQEGGQQDDAQKNKSAEESKSGTKGKKSSKYKESKSKKKKDRKGKSTAAAAGVEQEAVTVTAASDQSTTVSGGQDVSLVNADGKTENTKSSQDVLSQSGKVMESTQQMSSAVVILINDGKSSNTPKLDAKVNGASSVKDVFSAKQDITITKQDTTSAKKDAAITTTSVKQDIAITKQESTTSVKQNIATTKQDTTSARQDSISAEKGIATAQHAEGLAQKKLFKSGSVEVVNTAVLDDDDEEEVDGDIPDLKTPPKAKPALKNKSQSVEEIMAGIDDIVSGMKDVFDDKRDTSVSTADSKLSRATHSSSSFTRSESLSQHTSVTTNSKTVVSNVVNSAVQVSQTPSSTTPAVVTATSQANGTGSSSSSDGTKIVVVHSGTTNGGDKDATTGEAKPSKLEMELLTALNTLQHTVDEIKSNSQLAPHAQQMQHDLIQKIFELNSSPEFIARILSLWSLSQLGQQTSGTMSKSNSHQMITTGLEQQLQRARESEHHSREAREAAAVHESKKEHHVQHAKNHDLHLNIREHIDSYLQTVLGKHFRKKMKDGKSSKKPVRKDSDSDEDEEDDEGMVTIEATPGTSKPASRTLHAERRQQPLLTEETPRPNSAGKKLLMRRGTNMDLHATTAALQNLTSPKASLDEEEDMKNFAVAKPVPIRRAVIHKQQILEVSDVVPRPAPVNKVKSMVEQRVRNRS